MMEDYYGRRIQYHRPQNVTRPWLPWVKWKGMSDEFCNRSIWITLPLFLGVIVFFYGRKIRTYDDGYCDECRAEWLADTGVPYQPGMIGVFNGEPEFLDRNLYSRNRAK